MMKAATIVLTPFQPSLSRPWTIPKGTFWAQECRGWRTHAWQIARNMMHTILFTQICAIKTSVEVLLKTLRQIKLMVIQLSSPFYVINRQATNSWRGVFALINKWKSMLLLTMIHSIFLKQSNQSILSVLATHQSERNYENKAIKHATFSNNKIKLSHFKLQVKVFQVSNTNRHKDYKQLRTKSPCSQQAKRISWQKNHSFYIFSCLFTLKQDNCTDVQK